ncbi:hypothetical protein [Asanoa siamensis]|uniref:Uncharacterized protein n=1 Tax=Asanoa siamensis TaxID=926357 RepID=A0ABQ4CW93_9ACTN|nr:hypothetical protein [Asanoa siamensis]GIF75564.1 hypothetical protein Asi02nite_50820 [Asanoa siamensis]
MIRRLTPYLLVVLSLAGGLAALSMRPATAETKRSADYVVVVGIPGLRWEDVTQNGTPHLWRLAEHGSIGSLSVRSALKPTCPVDGWLTLGAGNFAGWRRTTPVTGPCPPLSVDIERPDGIGAFLPDLDRQAVQYNQQSQTWGAVPGALPQSVRCTSAIGPGAAVAAARPYGRVDNYEPELPANPEPLLGRCTLSMVDLGSVSGDDEAVRRTAAARADAVLARVLAARPKNSLVLVAGLADTDQASRLHVAIADGPGWDGGWLTSPGTGRDGYVQLVDLAPTALTALNRPRPERLFVGQPATSVPGRPEKLPEAVVFPADADREAGAQQNVATWFFGILALVQLGLAITVVPLLRGARRHVGDDKAVRRPISGVVEVLLVASALAIPAALVADLVPWWRGGHPGWLFAAVLVFVLAASTAVVRLAPAWRQTLGPLAMVVGAAAVVVGLDLCTGARLQLNGVAGYSVLEGNRYSGVGTVGLGVFIAGVLFGAGALAQRFARSWRPFVVVVAGGIGVFLVGSPYLGADPIGAVALTAGVCIATALSTGGWLTLGRLAAASVAGVAVTAVFAWIETRRPAAERGSLGRFVSALGDGTGGTTLQRTSKASMDALVNSPLTLLAVVGAVLLWVVLLRHWGGLRRAYGLYPSVRAGAIGIGVAVLLGGLLGGTGLELAGAAAAVAMPMAALTALRVLDHASDFTRPAEPEAAEGALTRGVGAG